MVNGRALRFLDDELLERDGVYASLFRLQFQDVLEAPGAAE